MELISVIVPVYNVQKYLARCIESILSQTYKKIEMIIVDDGSTDASGKICDRYGEIYSCITVLHKSNGGLSDARNHGLQFAKGKYVVFVDSDDVVEETYIEYLLKLIKKYDADIGICNCVHCYPGNIVCFGKETRVKQYNVEKAIATMLYQKDFLTTAWGKIFKKTYFDEIKFPVGMLYEDSAIMYKLFLQAKKIVYGNASKYGYYHRENSITTQDFNRKNFDILTIGKEIYALFLGKQRSLEKAARSYMVVGALRIYLNCPDKEEFLKERNYCIELLKREGKKVMLDHNARLKTRIGLLLYFSVRPILPYIYTKVDRWG